MFHVEHSLRGGPRSSDCRTSELSAPACASDAARPRSPTSIRGAARIVGAPCTLHQHETRRLASETSASRAGKGLGEGQGARIPHEDRPGPGSAGGGSTCPAPLGSGHTEQSRRRPCTDHSIRGRRSLSRNPDRWQRRSGAHPGRTSAPPGVGSRDHGQGRQGPKRGTRGDRASIPTTRLLSGAGRGPGEPNVANSGPQTGSTRRQRVIDPMGRGRPPSWRRGGNVGRSDRR